MEAYSSLGQLSYSSSSDLRALEELGLGLSYGVVGLRDLIESIADSTVKVLEGLV